jgi:thymidylate synthase (FAD)
VNDRYIYDCLGDNISEVTLIDWMGDDQRTLMGERTSHANDQKEHTPEQDRPLLKRLLGSEPPDGTVLEHITLTFRLKVPLYVVQEMLRHFSFNQQSHRYLALGEKVELEAYVPPTFRVQSAVDKQGADLEQAFTFEKQEEFRAMYEAAVEKCWEVYEYFLSKGMERGQARGVIPHSQYTSLYITCNLRALFDFLKLWDHSTAQQEIQEYARAMKAIARELFPLTFEILDEIAAEKALLNSQKE